MSIIAVLATLAVPVGIAGSRQYQLIQCLGQGRRIAQGTIQYLQGGGGDNAPKMSSKQWAMTLESYGVTSSHWVCPTRRRTGESKPGDIDFFYAGAIGDDVRSGVQLGTLYLWVEKYPNHSGMHVCAMGDGRAIAKNFLNLEL